MSNKHHSDLDPEADSVIERSRFAHTKWAWIVGGAAVTLAPLIALTIPWTVDLYQQFEQGYLGPIFQLVILVVAGFVYLGLAGCVLGLFVSAVIIGLEHVKHRNGWPLATLLVSAVGSGLICAWILRPPVYPVLTVDTLGNFRVTVQSEYPPLSMGTVLRVSTERMTYTGQLLHGEENWRLFWKDSLLNVCEQHARATPCASSIVRTLNDATATLLLLQDDPLGVRYWLAIDRESQLELRLLGELSRSVADKKCFFYRDPAGIWFRGSDELVWAQHDVFIDRRTLAMVPLCAISADAEDSLIAVSPDRRWAVFVELQIPDGLRVRVADVQKRLAVHAYYSLTKEDPAQQDQFNRSGFYESAEIFNWFNWDDNGIVAIPPFVLTPVASGE